MLIPLEISKITVRMLPDGEHGIATNEMEDIEKELNQAHHIINVRVNLRKGRKVVTLIEGLPAIRKTLTVLQKTFVCGGTILDESVIQLNGDHRSAVEKYLVEKMHYRPQQIMVHGF